MMFNLLTGDIVYILRYNFTFWIIRRGSKIDEPRVNLMVEVFSYTLVICVIFSISRHF